VQAATSTKNLDRAEIARRGSRESGYQPHGQGDCCAVREVDPQRVPMSAVHDGGGSRFSIRGTAPGTRGPSEIQSHLLVYPARHHAYSSNRTLGISFDITWYHAVSRAHCPKIAPVSLEFTHSTGVRCISRTACRERFAVARARVEPMILQTDDDVLDGYGDFVELV